MVQIATVMTLVPAKLLQLSPTLCNPMDHSPPGSSVHGILHAILEWVAMPFSRGLPDPEIEPGSLTSPALAGRFFFFLPQATPGKPK